MNARIIEEQAALFPHAATTRMTRETEIEAIRFAAIRARDEALAAGLRKLLTSIGQGLVALARAARSWPERHRTYESLRALTDRELADIGMTRGDIARVFEPGFTTPVAKPANSNRIGAGKVAAA